MVELLAPAGTREALVAAVENGADAVYLAGGRFGARAYAENFSAEDLREAVRFAHLRGVAVHVAVNTIIADEETADLADYLRFLYDAGADAIIVQDLGVARLARQIAAPLALHASTQMTVHNLAGVRALEEMGFTRIVLARELSLAEIRHICAHSQAEIEVFVHGALCISYSGQCLMSSLIGGRSGNRGRCAQPCRLPYQLVNGAGKDMLGESAGNFLLSPRDLNASEMIPDLLAAGVASLKIEGRMKRPEYVAVAVRAYRRAVDEALGKARDEISREDDKRSLMQIFNRDFTADYLKESVGREMMSDRKPNNRGLLIGRVLHYDKARQLVTVRLSENIHPGDEIDAWIKVGGRTTFTVTSIQDREGEPLSYGAKGTVIQMPLPVRVKEHDRLFRVYDSVLMKEVQRTFKSGGPLRRIPVKAHLQAEQGAPVTLEFIAADGAQAKAASEFLGVAAEKSPLTHEAAQRQIDRLGTTVYQLAAFTAAIDPAVMVPVSVLNELRRSAAAQLDEVRLKKYERPALAAVDAPQKAEGRSTVRAAQLMVSVDSLAQARAALAAGADGILFGGDSYHHQQLLAEEYRAAWHLAREKNKIIHFNTPRILRENRVAAFCRLLKEMDEFPADGINVHNVGTLALAREHTAMAIQSDFSLATYNACTLSALKERGVVRATLSPELTWRQMEALAGESPLPLEAIVGGYLELMVSAYCAVGSFLGRTGAEKCSGPCHREKYFLKDRKGALFPLAMDGACQMHILNSKPLSMLPHVMKFAAMGIERLRIEGRGYDGQELSSVVRNYRECMRYGGALKESEERRIQAMEGDDFTRGHYFRGVL